MNVSAILATLKRERAKLDRVMTALLALVAVPQETPAAEAEVPKRRVYKRTKAQRRLMSQAQLQFWASKRKLSAPGKQPKARAHAAGR